MADSPSFMEWSFDFEEFDEVDEADEGHEMELDVGVRDSCVSFVVVCSGMDVLALDWFASSP